MATVAVVPPNACSYCQTKQGSREEFPPFHKHCKCTTKEEGEETSSGTGDTGGVVAGGVLAGMLGAAVIGSVAGSQALATMIGMAEKLAVKSVGLSGLRQVKTSVSQSVMLSGVSRKMEGDVRSFSSPGSITRTTRDVIPSSIPGMLAAVFETQKYEVTYAARNIGAMKQLDGEYEQIQAADQGGIVATSGTETDIPLQAGEGKGLGSSAGIGDSLGIGTAGETIAGRAGTMLSQAASVLAGPAVSSLLGINGYRSRPGPGGLPEGAVRGPRAATTATKGMLGTTSRSAMSRFSGVLNDRAPNAKAAASARAEMAAQSFRGGLPGVFNTRTANAAASATKGLGSTSSITARISSMLNPATRNATVAAAQEKTALAELNAFGRTAVAARAEAGGERALLGMLGGAGVARALLTGVVGAVAMWAGGEVLSAIGGGISAALDRGMGGNNSGDWANGQSNAPENTAAYGEGMPQGIDGLLANAASSSVVGPAIMSHFNMAGVMGTISDIGTAMAGRMAENVGLSTSYSSGTEGLGLSIGLGGGDAGNGGDSAPGGGEGSGDSGGGSGGEGGGEGGGGESGGGDSGGGEGGGGGAAPAG
jgi:hypothetical protein